MAFGKIKPFYHGSDDREDLAEINMIPLIDVMLVLLIVFMISAPLSLSGIKVNLPQSKAKGAQVDESKIILTVDQKGDFYLGQMLVEKGQLSRKIGLIFQSRTDKSLFIRADKNVAYGSVVDAMSAAKLAGIQKIAMLTTPQTSRQN